MEILVTESTPDAARSAIERLEQAGHHVHRCHAPGDPAFPCAGVAGECPFDTNPIDLVLTLRGHIRATPAPAEDGVACALRRRVPVAVTGRSAMNPFEPFGAAVVDEDELVGACEQLARSRRQDHEQVAVEVARAAMTVAGLASEAVDVAVHRVAGRLRVEVTVPDGTPTPVRDVVAVRVAGRLRAFDPYAGGIDIGVHAPGETAMAADRA